MLGVAKKACRNTLLPDEVRIPPIKRQKPSKSPAYWISSTPQLTVKTPQKPASETIRPLLEVHSGVPVVTLP